MKNALSLISQYDQYLKEGHPDDLRLFADWLKNQNAPKETLQTDNPEVDAAGLNVMVTYLLQGTANYLEIWLKLAFSDTPLTSIHDFGLLKTIEDLGGEATKKELTSRMISDYSSVIEMIKRLVKQGIFSEKPDPDDRRSKIVTLTKKGKQLSQVLYPKMQNLSNLAVGELNEDEKNSIISICKKLYHFHDHLYRAKNKDTIKTLYEL